MLRMMLALPLFLAPMVATAQTLPADQAAIKAHVAYLASDDLRGREAGTPDFDRAADYVVTQMKAAGLAPGAGGGSWFQPVTLVTYKPAGPASFAMTRGGTRTVLDPATEFLGNADPVTTDLKGSGEVVFVGFGIDHAASGNDDYKGLDVSGKIVAVLNGVPKGLPADVAAHMGSPREKMRIAEAHGAKGMFVIESVQQAREVPFAVVARYLTRARTTTANPDGTVYAPGAGKPTFGMLSQGGAAKLFAGGPVAWADVVAAQEKGTAMPRGAIGASIDFAGKTQVSRLQSKNVIGLLEGSDPALKGQYLVMSAHLDHVGVGDPVNGDTIYNGAMDNGIGTAAVLEVARAFKTSGKRPRRSVLFISLTAEEKGLLGSGYFARNPTVPKEALVGNVNLDMPIMTFPLVDLVALGQEHSTIGPVVAEAAREVGLAVVPDPFPEENFFVRSDHYSFVQAGVPAVSIDTGPGGEGKAAIKDFLAKHYHKPSDQIDLPFNWESAAKYVRVNYGVIRRLADADQRPAWNKGDVFGVQFDGYGAK